MRTETRAAQKRQPAAAIMRSRRPFSAGEGPGAGTEGDDASGVAAHRNSMWYVTWAGAPILQV